MPRQPPAPLRAALWLGPPTPQGDQRPDHPSYLDRHNAQQDQIHHPCAAARRRWRLPVQYETCHPVGDRVIAPWIEQRVGIH
jgi:hypothetical protein